MGFGSGLFSVLEGVLVCGKRSILEKMMMIKRCEEEQQLVKTEMSNLLVYYTQRLVPALNEKIDLINEEQTVLTTLSGVSYVL